MTLTTCSDPGPHHHERHSPDPVRLLLLGLRARQLLPRGQLALPRPRHPAGNQAPSHWTLGTGTYIKYLELSNVILLYHVKIGYCYTFHSPTLSQYVRSIVLQIIMRIFLAFLQVMEQQSRQPFMTICQVSTIDGSPRLERQVIFCDYLIIEIYRQFQYNSILY